MLLVNKLLNKTVFDYENIKLCNGELKSRYLHILMTSLSGLEKIEIFFL